MRIARILTLEEVINMGDELMWLEYKTANVPGLKSVNTPGLESIIFPTSPYNDNSLAKYSVSFQSGHVQSRKLYGKQWRCWTEKPSKEQRKAVKWE